MHQNNAVDVLVEYLATWSMFARSCYVDEFNEIRLFCPCMGMNLLVMVIIYGLAFVHPSSYWNIFPCKWNEMHHPPWHPSSNQWSIHGQSMVQPDISNEQDRISLLQDLQQQPLSLFQWGQMPMAEERNSNSLMSFFRRLFLPPIYSSNISVYPLFLYRYSILFFIPFFH